MKISPIQLALSALLCGLLSACTSPDDGGQNPSSLDSKPPDPMLPQVWNSAFEKPSKVFMKNRAWTTAFDDPALLFADSIYIEGPSGLLDHFIPRHADEYHSYEAETRPEGFRQVYRVLDPSMGVELRGYLDGLEMVVIKEMIVVEKPGELDVLVRATGNVYYRDSTTGKEQRAQTLSFTGPIGPAPGRAETDAAPVPNSAAPDER